MRLVFIALVPMSLLSARAQDTTDYAIDTVVEEADWVLYRGGFDFKEGIYRTFSEFRLNAPSAPIGDLYNSEGLRITDLTDQDGRIFQADSAGGRTPVRWDNVWGYCNNNAVYMATRNGFQRIQRLGSLCHMLVEEWQVGMGMGMGQSAPVLVQRFLDTHTGRFDVLNASSLAAALQRDPGLYNEFMALPARQRNKDATLIQFLNKFNGRQPLTFPPS